MQCTSPFCTAHLLFARAVHGFTDEPPQHICLVAVVACMASTFIAVLRVVDPKDLPTVWAPQLVVLVHLGLHIVLLLHMKGVGILRTAPPPVVVW